MTQAWRTIQLFLAMWIVPFAPIAITLSTIHALGWPAWGIAVTVVVVLWPLPWFVWLLGGEDAIRR